MCIIQGNQEGLFGIDHVRAIIEEAGKSISVVGMNYVCTWVTGLEWHKWEDVISEKKDEDK